LDKNEGTFTAEDEALIKQLAHVASIQIESLLLVQRTRSAEARYRQAESIARLVHWSCHQPVTGSWQLSTLTFSDQAITVLGVSSTELRLTTEEFISRIVHPVDRDRVRLEISESVTARRTHYHLDYRIQRPDGAVAHISEVCHDVYDRSGNWISSFGIMQDVTVHKLLEQALKESSARYRKAERIAKLVHWSIEINRDGQWENDILAFSDAAAELLGTSDKQRQLASKDYLQQIVHQDDRDRVRAALDKALSNRETDISVTYRIMRLDGCVRWVVEHVENEYDESGNRTFAFGIIQDVTEQKQRETELKEAYLQANLASRAKSQFLATMSHELRTPLNAIIGFSEVMQREMLGPLGSEGYKEYASDIHNSGTFLLAIINELLDLSLIDAGEMKLDESYVDIDKLAASCLSLLRAKAISKGIALVQVTQPEGPGVRGDARRIKQAVINILSNAIKFTPSGGTVEISTAWSGEGVTISVKDTGVGIAPADLERVAKPFVQLESWLTREHEGIGLGLPIAKAICELHGGRLMLESELGIGTVVRMWLPASRTDLTSASASH
jgi:two-component system cell cycle sensor histidine kinase PleC